MVNITKFYTEAKTLVSNPGGLQVLFCQEKDDSFFPGRKLSESFCSIIYGFFYRFRNLIR